MAKTLLKGLLPARQKNDFIKCMVINGLGYVEAYKRALCLESMSEGDTIKAKNCFNRYQFIIEDLKDSEIKDIAKARNLVKVRDAYSKIISQAEADAIISGIITGHVKVTKVFYDAELGSVVEHEVAPDAGDRIAAYNAFCKRFGTFAPKNTNLTLTKNNVLKVEFVQSAPVDIGKLQREVDKIQIEAAQKLEEIEEAVIIEDTVKA